MKLNRDELLRALHQKFKGSDNLQYAMKLANMFIMKNVYSNIPGVKFLEKIFQSKIYQKFWLTTETEVRNGIKFLVCKISTGLIGSNYITLRISV